MIKLEKEKNTNKQEIGCEVHDCKFCDCHDNCCSLEKIEVCNCGHDHEKEATMCNSYQKRDN